MTNPTRYSLVLSLLLSVAAIGAEAPKTTPAPKEGNATAVAPTKSKKKKAIRPGVEWQPAPAPLKW